MFYQEGFTNYLQRGSTHILKQKWTFRRGIELSWFSVECKHVGIVGETMVCKTCSVTFFMLKATRCLDLFLRQSMWNPFPEMPIYQKHQFAGWGFISKSFWLELPVPPPERYKQCNNVQIFSSSFLFHVAELHAGFPSRSRWKLKLRDAFTLCIYMVVVHDSCFENFQAEYWAAQESLFDPSTFRGYYKQCVRRTEVLQHLDHSEGNMLSALEMTLVIVQKLVELSLVGLKSYVDKQ